MTELEENMSLSDTIKYSYDHYKKIKNQIIDLNFIMNNYRYTLEDEYDELENHYYIRSYFIEYTSFENCTFMIHTGLNLNEANQIVLQSDSIELSGSNNSLYPILNIQLLFASSSVIINCKIKDTNLYGLTCNKGILINGLLTESSYIKNIDLGYSKAIYQYLFSTNPSLFIFDLKEYPKKKIINLCKNILKNISIPYKNIDFTDLKYDNFETSDISQIKDISIFINKYMIGKHIKINKMINLPKYGNGFFGYKILSDDKYKRDWLLAKVYIPGNTGRVSTYGKKCRAGAVRLESVTPIGCEIGEANYNYHLLSLSNEKLKERLYCSLYTSYYDTKYRVGKYTKADNLDKSEYITCSNGIHFFITKEDAMQYYYNIINLYINL